MKILCDLAYRICILYYYEMVVSKNVIGHNHILKDENVKPILNVSDF